jgi:hypothetical protein
LSRFVANRAENFLRPNCTGFVQPDQSLVFSGSVLAFCYSVSFSFAPTRMLPSSTALQQPSDALGAWHPDTRIAIKGR